MHMEVMSVTEPLFRLAPGVVFLPVAGILLNLLLGERWSEKLVGWIASLATVGAFGVAVALAVGLSRHPEGAVVPLLTWIHIGDFRVDWAFRVDTLSVVMMLVVAGVGALIHIYSIGYMHEDVRHNGDPRRFRRFFVFLNLFIAAMMILVSANNFLMLFVGWEGVGLCSYLLIGFWFEKGAGGIGNALAAKKAFVVNRIGDFGLLIALFLIFVNFGSLDFDAVFGQASHLAQVAPGVLTAITLFMLLGVTGKSAQIPLYVWLPDAMAGPTPVSALIHAATMVTAGVYLVARSQALYLEVPLAQSTVTWVGGLTALLAATIALGQYDIKRVLAYSTISQLGFMVAAVGMGAAVAGMFHLVTHAFFKALLFLSAGSVILGMERGHEAGHHHQVELDPQDMRYMGGLRQRMPLTFWVYLIGALALAGVAPLAGFFSKDEILAAANLKFPAVFGILLFSALLTALYMGRQLALVFFGSPRSEAAEKATESAPIVTAPLVVLAGLSVVGGLINAPGIYALEHWLEHTLHTVEAIPFQWTIAASSLAVALIGLGLAWWLYGQRPLPSPRETDPLARLLDGVYHALERKWWVDEIYHALFVRPYQVLAQGLAQAVDLGVIDGIVNGVGQLARQIALWWRKWQNGYVRSYALTFVVGVVLIVAYLLLR